MLQGAEKKNPLSKAFVWKEGVWAAFRFYLARFYVVLDFI